MNSDSARLRLLTFNIRFGSGGENIHMPGYKLPIFPKSIETISTAIDSVEPDVVALQEVRGAAQAEKIASKLGINYAYISHQLGYRLYFFEWGLALLFRFKMLATDRRSLIFDDKTQVGRMALMGTMDVEGRPVTFINLHFDHRDISGQVDELAAWTETHQYPLVIMGDLNCEPEDPRLKPLRAYMNDTCRMVSTASSKEAQARGTLLANRRRVDHIWTDGDHFKVIDAGILPTSLHRISDHIGYFADVEIV